MLRKFAISLYSIIFEIIMISQVCTFEGWSVTCYGVIVDGYLFAHFSLSSRRNLRYIIPYARDDPKIPTCGYFSLEKLEPYVTHAWTRYA
jgi:hypothetical protein